MTSSTDPGQKSSSEIEREIEEDRQRLKRTTRDIQERLSLGTLIDEALSRGRAHGPEYAGNLGRLIRDNPVPVTIIGVCLAWLMAGGQRDYHRGPTANGRVMRPSGDADYPSPAERAALSPAPAPRAAPPGDSVRAHTPPGGVAAREPGSPGAAGPAASGTGDTARTLAERTRTSPTGAVTPGTSGSTGAGSTTAPPASGNAQSPTATPGGGKEDNKP